MFAQARPLTAKNKIKEPGPENFRLSRHLIDTHMNMHNLCTLNHKNLYMKVYLFILITVP